MRVEFSLVQTLDSRGNPVALSKKQIFTSPTADGQGQCETAMAPTYSTQQGVPVIVISDGKFQTIGGDVLTEVRR